MDLFSSPLTERPALALEPSQSGYLRLARGNSQSTLLSRQHASVWLCSSSRRQSACNRTCEQRWPSAFGDRRRPLMAFLRLTTRPSLLPPDRPRRLAVFIHAFERTIQGRRERLPEWSPFVAAIGVDRRTHSRCSAPSVRCRHALQRAGRADAPLPASYSREFGAASLCSPQQGALRDSALLLLRRSTRPPSGKMTAPRRLRSLQGRQHFGGGNLLGGRAFLAPVHADNDRSICSVALAGTQSSHLDTIGADALTA